ISGSKHSTYAESPKSRHPVSSNAVVDVLDSAHIEAVLLSKSPSSTFSWYSAENYSAQALTMELGRVARIDDNALDRLTAFDLALRNLIAEAQPE
ncbi:succinylglutamate desuccinylase/aspartoacylase family protein, partial [Vibrio parahaemolyticus]